MTKELTLYTGSVEETLEIGRVIGALLHAGDFVALCGPLGAGKTHLTKGLVAGMGFAYPDEVNSPTFVLINEYPARLHVHHIDAYRLNSAGELFDIGYQEMLDRHAVIIMEWADRVAALVPAHALWITLRPVGQYQRELLVETTSQRLAADIAAAGVDRRRQPDDKFADDQTR